MKAKILALFVGLAMVSAVRSEILYWTIDEQTPLTHDSWATAKIAASDGVSSVYLQTYGADAQGYVSKLSSDAVYSSIIDASEYSNAASSFYIELYNSAGTMVGWSNPRLTWNDISEFVKEGASFAEVANFSGAQFHAVPEPTSGLMLLVGMAMLGLRRRKVA